jgi:hypothetical protein
MKGRLSIIGLVLFFFAGCESTNDVPPPVTVRLAARIGHGQRVDVATLQQGRSLFVSRCIECHTLPRVSEHSASDWPRLIDEMADRANLKPTERNAVVAYILAARQP